MILNNCVPLLWWILDQIPLQNTGNAPRRDYCEALQAKGFHITKVKYRRFQMDDVWQIIKYFIGGGGSVQNSDWLKCKWRAEHNLRSQWQSLQNTYFLKVPGNKHLQRPLQEWPQATWNLSVMNFVIKGIEITSWSSAFYSLWDRKHSTDLFQTVFKIFIGCYFLKEIHCANFDCRAT